MEGKSVLLRNYELGTERSATVGEPIFRVQQAREIPVFVAQRDYPIPHTRTTVPAGTRFVAIGRDPAGNYIVAGAMPPRATSLLYFGVSEDGERFGTIPRLANPKIVWLTQEVSPFRRLTDLGEQPGAFTAELVYSGLAGGVVRAVYREYVDDYARPAFTQELQYDLGADRVIAYKSVRIRVLDATNTTIQYQVIDDDGLPWLPAPRAPTGTVLPAPH